MYGAIQSFIVLCFVCDKKVCIEKYLEKKIWW